MDGLKPCQFRQVDPAGRILCNLIKGGDREVSVNLCRACPVMQINCQHLRAGLEKKVSTPITVRFATGKVEVWDDTPPAIDFKQAACASKTMPIHSPRDCAGCPIRLPNVIPQTAIQVAHRSKPAIAAQTPALAAVPPSNAPVQAPALAQSQATPVAEKPRAPRAKTQRAAPAPQSAVAVQPAVSQPAASEPVLSSAAADLVARARATAQKKAKEQAAARAAANQSQPPAPALTPEGKPKIIQIQQWLAGQLSRKQMHQPLPTPADEDGVSEIIYSPLGAQMAVGFQETPDYERCVGWTD